MKIFIHRSDLQMFADHVAKVIAIAEKAGVKKLPVVPANVPDMSEHQVIHESKAIKAHVAHNVLHVTINPKFVADILKSQRNTIKVMFAVRKPIMKAVKLLQADQEALARKWEI